MKSPKFNRTWTRVSQKPHRTTAEPIPANMPCRGGLISSGQAWPRCPRHGTASRGHLGNYIQLMQDYAYDIFLFIGLAVATLAFFGQRTPSARTARQDGKGTWGQLGVNFVPACCCWCSWCFAD